MEKTEHGRFDQKTSKSVKIFILQEDRRADYVKINVSDCHSLKLVILLINNQRRSVLHTAKLTKKAKC